MFASVPVAPSLGSGDWGEEEPRTLDAYFDRLPAKSVGRIFEETAPYEEWISAPNIPDALRTIASKVKTEPAENLVAEVDKLLALTRKVRARKQAPASEQPLLPAKDLNLLHDVRDALVASGADAADYIAWRLDYDALIQPATKLDSDNSFSPRTLPVLPKTVVAEVEKRAAEAQGPIRAQWLYVRGALAFHHGNKAEARGWFDKVRTEFPSHPRAEIALFMKGRCLLSESRSDSYDFDERIKDRGLHDATRETFQSYLTQYPQGRFVADAKGWLGALAWDEEDYLGSLEWYIRQAETPDHPEVLKSAVLMIEKTLRRLAADDNAENSEKAFAVVATHPRVAMGMLYLVLGSPDAAFRYRYPDNDSETPSVLTEKIRNWRRTLLPRLASAVAAQKQIYAADDWQSRYLALLVHAASNAGQHEEALRLAALSPKPEENDDLLFAKAIALQRAGKAPEAIATFRLLLKNPPPFRSSEKRFHTCRFPGSVLANGARIRLAIALRDNHQAGLAILELKKLEKQNDAEQGSDPEVRFPADYRLDFTDTGIYTDFSNAEPEQIRQLTDTLLAFAPLPELAAALNAPEVEPGLACDLRAVIAKRALAREDFKTAQQVMTAAQYGLQAAILEQLTIEARNPKLKPQEKAALELRVGDAWAAAQGRLLAHNGDLKRRANARAIGFKEPDDEMEQSEELVHAWHWWLRAARTAPGTAVAASARLKTLQAMARLARGSDYFLARATEEDWSGASRQIYDRLQTENPRSEEAKQAVWWSFELPVRKDRSNKENFEFASDYGSDKPGYAGYWWSDYGVLGSGAQENGGWERQNLWQKTIASPLLALRETALDLPGLTSAVAKLREQAKATYTNITEIACLNCLDDLAAFLAEQGLTQETARAYINLRLDVLARSFWGYSPVRMEVTGIPKDTDPDAVVRERIAAALKDPQFKAVRDYLEFLDAAMVANHQIRIAGDDDKTVSYTIPRRDYPALERMIRDFLKRYPHSQKREAARLLLARAVFRQSWPRYQSDYPSQNLSGGPELSYQQEPLKPKRVLAVLDEYNKEFPSGRYAADIRNMRAGVLWRTGDWQPALKLTLAQWDEEIPDLQMDVAFRLANLFAELASPEHRNSLLTAIRGNPEALEPLQRYLAEAPNYRDHPLRFMSGYLREQLGIKPPVAGKP